MVFSFFRKKLNDISISRKLYFTVGIMALLVTVELCTLWFAVTTLSSVRSFVNGEGLWSKAEKDAVLSLRVYAYSHNEEDYQAYHHFLQVSKGDKKARMALLKPKPDIEAARQGFLEGRNHPDDIDGMIHLVLRFHNVSYLRRAFTYWIAAEPVIDHLTTIAEDLHKRIQAGASQEEINESLAEVTTLNRRLTTLEDGFSFVLGEGARWLENVVLRLLLTLSLTIGTTSIIITISVSRGIERGLKAIIDGAVLIGQGLLNNRVKVYSRDEIGTLATAFNEMTDTLQKNRQEIKEKEENLEKARQRAESSEKVKQFFLMNISHEIRTPMNAILGFAHLLEDSMSNEEQKEYIQLLITAGDELLSIFNDIIDFSKMESGRVVLETMPFKMEEMINELTDEMRHKATEKRIHLSSFVDKKIPEVILGDGKRLNKVLANLLSNAIKFTDAGEVNISVIIINDKPHYIELEFSIKDTGIGIPEEQQGKIFESFEQVNSSSERKFGGTGLGLSIVRQLVELQGGKVFVNSTPGRGSEFYFRLSFLKAKTDRNEQLNPDKIRPGGLADTEKGEGKILIVDDNLMNRMLVVKVLQKKGYETDTAENGKIAVFKVENHEYDMVLMDLQMPEMDGYEATRLIRARKDNKKDIPIIAMTAHAMKGEKERCMEMGMDGFIPKPFYPEELYGKINELLKKA